MSNVLKSLVIYEENADIFENNETSEGKVPLVLR